MRILLVEVDGVSGTVVTYNGFDIRLGSSVSYNTTGKVYGLVAATKVNPLIINRSVKDKGTVDKVCATPKVNAVVIGSFICYEGTSFQGQQGYCATKSVKSAEGTVLKYNVVCSAIKVSAVYVSVEYAILEYYSLSCVAVTKTIRSREYAILEGSVYGVSCCRTSFVGEGCSYNGSAVNINGCLSFKYGSLFTVKSSTCAKFGCGEFLIGSGAT